MSEAIEAPPCCVGVTARFVFVLIVVAVISSLSLCTKSIAPQVRTCQPVYRIYLADQELEAGVSLRRGESSSSQHHSHVGCSSGEQMEAFRACRPSLPEGTLDFYI